MNASLKFMIRSMIIILVIVTLTACGASQQPTGSSGVSSKKELPGADKHPEAIELYRTSCIVCHGAELEGKVGDASNLQTVGARLSRDEIFETITNGRNLMPDFKTRLSEEEIALLSDWLAEQQ